MSGLSRRRFIQMAGAGFAVSATPVFSGKAKAQAGKKIGVALVGLGYYSRGLLAPALQVTKHCELRGIVTGSPAPPPVATTL